ncbi:DUF58 domain-containing protein [Fulvimonas soli]|jgi:uncharacterized protein (DUF58 family)|uniref:Uncharacterized protein (DUF58 family) n=1 Tax=Fulvimonas soli TaxID=155197 RepID=A0A316IDL8_9GAMM|nr:DUF58 domain-containing protein [Fulvimonas soli]PWK85361.1 uncharacterized protein (DUF58 family) [Fulvimonas soli]TNY25376.1 hypothetical protein BV497_14145 [Fulvimonas soli]
MRQALRRLQQAAERRLPALTRYRRPEPLPIELHRRRIYIVPTGFGLGFGVLLLVMLLGGLNYANNAALLLTCVLGAAAAASMLATFRALHGLRLGAIQAGQAMAGDPLAVTLAFESAHPREALRVSLDRDPAAAAFAVPAGRAEVTLRIATQRRGWQALPRLRVWSTWPLGLFRAWSWLHPQQQVLVWPRPEVSGPAPAAPDGTRQRPRLHHGDDLATLRDYRGGDPLRHVAWKASARHHGLLVKDFEQPQVLQEWRLDWRELPGLDPEARIARLARWLGEARARGLRWSLWLPGDPIGTGSGQAHYARCMSALALLP